jgi:hypothetical protein
MVDCPANFSKFSKSDDTKPKTMERGRPARKKTTMQAGHPRSIQGPAGIVPFNIDAPKLF